MQLYGSKDASRLLSTVKGRNIFVLQDVHKHDLHRGKCSIAYTDPTPKAVVDAIAWNSCCYLCFDAAMLYGFCFCYSDYCSSIVFVTYQTFAVLYATNRSRGVKP